MSWELISLLLFVPFSIAWILLKLNYKIPTITGVILLLASACSFMVTDEQTMLNWVSILAFYFLLSGLIISLIDYLRAQ